jgi:segregation and condensation protein A
MPETSPDVLAEFTTIASRLFLLKSRSLLPSEPVQDDEVETDDLTQQLLAYKAVKDAAMMLKERQDEGVAAYRRPPTAQDWGDSAESLHPMPASVLIRAIRRCMNRAIPEVTSYRPRPVITLAEMTRRIVDHLRGHRKAAFSELLSQRADRHEHVAGFVALLTLWKHRAVDLWQSERFAEIEIEHLQSHVPAHEQVADD